MILFLVSLKVLKIPVIVPRVMALLLQSNKEIGFKKNRLLAQEDTNLQNQLIPMSKE